MLSDNPIINNIKSLFRSHSIMEGLHSPMLSPASTLTSTSTSTVTSSPSSSAYSPDLKGPYFREIWRVTNSDSEDEDELDADNASVYNHEYVYYDIREEEEYDNHDDGQFKSPPPAYNDESNYQVDYNFIYDNELNNDVEIFDIPNHIIPRISHHYNESPIISPLSLSTSTFDKNNDNEDKVSSIKRCDTPYPSDTNISINSDTVEVSNPEDESKMDFSWIYCPYQRFFARSLGKYVPENWMDRIIVKNDLFSEEYNNTKHNTPQSALLDHESIVDSFKYNDDLEKISSSAVSKNLFKRPKHRTTKKIQVSKLCIEA